jgi:hypothetical protein
VPVCGRMWELVCHAKDGNIGRAERGHADCLSVRYTGTMGKESLRSSSANLIEGQYPVEGAMGKQTVRSSFCISLKARPVKGNMGKQTVRSSFLILFKEIILSRGMIGKQMSAPLLLVFCKETIL